MTKLLRVHCEWALKHVQLEGDTDLFPPPFEIEVLRYQKRAVIKALSNIDIGSYQWTGGRRFVVPKGPLAFRTATQLDPVDNLLLVGLIKKHGQKIEAARISPRVAFSYRFDPSNDGRIYGTESRWKHFWESCQKKAATASVGFVAIGDVADYYNQISHHTLEQELAAARLPTEAVRSILNLMRVHTEKLSRGIPIGPHGTHLLAEIAFNPIDRALESEGLTFRRYVDDVHFFCRTRDDAQIALYKFAEVLDDQQRLTLQDRKTEIVSAIDYTTHASTMVLNQPLNEDEEEILRLIAEASGGDYDDVSLEDLTEEQLEYFDADNLASLFDVYFSCDPVPFSRLGWLLRRLSRVETPGAMLYVLQNIELFQPVLGDAVRYVQNASHYYDGDDWEEAGGLILKALKLPVVKNSPFVQMSLINLFSRVPAFNHVTRLTSQYDNHRAEAQREIISAAVAAEAYAWLRQRKRAFRNMDRWQRRALLEMVRVLPGDEGKFWRQSVESTLSGMERCTVEWARDHKLKGGISVCPRRGPSAVRSADGRSVGWRRGCAGASGGVSRGVALGGPRAW